MSLFPYLSQQPAKFNRIFLFTSTTIFSYGYSVWRISFGLPKETIPQSSTATQGHLNSFYLAHLLLEGLPLLVSLACRQVTTVKFSAEGFTLKELLVSLAVFSIATGWGLPYLIEMIPNYRLTSAARSLVVQIHRAKLRALNQSTICYFDFDLDGDGDLESEAFFLWGDRNGNRRKELLEKSDMVFDLRLFPEVHLQAYPAELGGPERGPNNTEVNAGGGDGVSFAQNRIKFNPDGTCSTGTVYLHNGNNRTFAIRLRYNCLTQLWRYYGQDWERW